jgi:hypothetical protein
MYGAVRLEFVLTHKSFRPGHKLLHFSKPVCKRHRTAPPIKDKATPTADRGLPVLSGLGNREEHHTLMIVH